MFKFPKKKEKNINNDNIIKILNRPDEREAISPTLIKEIDFKDITIDGKPTDYYVEVGTTIGTNRYYRSFFANLLAENTYFGMFNDLFLGRFGDADCDIVIDILPSDDRKTRYFLTRKIASLEADLMNEQNSIKRKEISDQLQELHHQEERLRKNIEQLFSVSIQATVSSNNLKKVKMFSNSMIKRMSNQGIFFRSADTKQLPALLNLAGLTNSKKEFKHTFKSMETSNIADMFPLGFGTISHKKGEIIGEDIYGKPVFYNDRHPNLQNYNSVTFGVSGSGKSMKTKILQARKLINPSPSVMTIIDYEKENKEWLLELGFPYIEFTSNNNKFNLNIFPIPRTIKSSKGIFLDLDDSVNTVSAIIFKMLRITTENPIQGNKKILIKEQIQNCYNKVKGITYDVNSLYLNTTMQESGVFSLQNQIKPMPQLIELYELMNSVPELKEEAQIIKAFTKAGNIRSQSVFDCQSNVNLSSTTAVGLSVEGLDEIMKPLGLYIASSNTWSAYEKLPKTIKKDIIIDEAQNMMEFDEEADWLENRFRIARRRNIGVHVITQGFEVFLRKQQGLGILKNASTKFLFRQDPLDIEAVENKFNLPDGAKTRLLNFDAGECIFIAGNEMALMKTKPLPHEYPLFSTDPTETEGEVF